MMIGWITLISAMACLVGAVVSLYFNEASEEE